MKYRVPLFITLVLFFACGGGITAGFCEETKASPPKPGRYEYPPDLINTGLQLLKDGKYNEAVTLFKNVIKDDPVSLSGYICLARAYKSREDDAGVIKTYQDGIQAMLRWKKLAGEDLSGDASILSARLAEEYASLRRQDEALAAAKRAIELSPRDPTHHMTLGWIYKSFGDKNKARQSFETALALARSTDAKILILRLEKIITELKRGT